ncbi:hypothetical protein [Paraflavitalea speifideaquila]|uniref:hypothetical protein n=1 Tax=Paraflavitalea speifideaquila TaxID=3076558 RepID=UPI0028EBCE5F|nr:hypothetical protein [Paraflavitalea speifideiaquila]
MIITKQAWVLSTLCCLTLFSCQKEDAVEETAYLRKYWNEMAGSQYEVPVTRGTELKARFFLNLMTDDVFITTSWSMPKEKRKPSPAPACTAAQPPAQAPCWPT